MGSTQFSVREAAERVGVSRQTMFRHIKDGKISATIGHDGQKQIELSELLRVFGELQRPETTPATVTDRPRLSRTSKETPRDSALIQVEFARLQAQLEIRTAELELAKERINELKAREHSAGEEKNRLLSLIERQSLLLAAPAPVATPKPAPRRATVKKTAPATKAAARSKTVKSKPETVTAKPATSKTARTTATKKPSAPTPVKKAALKPAPKKAAKAPATKATARTTKPAAAKRSAR